MHELLPNDVGCSFITWQVHLWDCVFLNIFHRHITVQKIPVLESSAEGQGQGQGETGHQLLGG